MLCFKLGGTGSSGIDRTILLRKGKKFENLLDFDAAETCTLFITAKDRQKQNCQKAGGFNNRKVQEEDMEYGIRELAQMAGVSARTLRYYDEIGLLKPLYTTEAGYRYYGEKEAELLQQILFYRERGMGLQQISRIIHEDSFDVFNALEEHLFALEAQRENIDRLIFAVKRTMASMKGEITMDTQEKFQVFKEKVVRKKEEAYGKESRAKYGDMAVEEANRRILDMTEEDYERFQNLGEEILKQLEEAVREGEDPRGEKGKRIVKLHKEWLGYTWKTYSEQAHKGLAAMYVEDERFTKYYDRQISGCAKFLKEAAEYWISKESI